jgi:hypothetical protein
MLDRDRVKEEVDAWLNTRAGIGRHSWTRCDSEPVNGRYEYYLLELPDQKARLLLYLDTFLLSTSKKIEMQSRYHHDSGAKIIEYVENLLCRVER